MKNTILKALGFIVTIFTVSQLSQAKEAQVQSTQVDAQTKPPHSTDKHGGDCCCTTCIDPSEKSLMKTMQ